MADFLVDYKITTLTKAELAEYSRIIEDILNSEDWWFNGLINVDEILVRVQAALNHDISGKKDAINALIFSRFSPDRAAVPNNAQAPGIFQPNRSGDSTMDEIITFSDVSQSNSSSSSTIGDTALFCCDKFQPLRRIGDSQDATLWAFAREMSCHSIPASSQQQKPFMLAILSLMLDCAGYIIQYEKWVEAEGQGKRYFLPHPKREGGYLEVAEEMVRDKELKGEYKMYWGYVKIKCLDHPAGGMFQMLRIFQRVLTEDVEVPAVKRKQSYVLRPALSRNRAEIIKAKRDAGHRELRDGMSDWMDMEG